MAHDVRFPSIEGLRAFDAAARLGTFERAADELAVTASAIGKRIQTLEDLLGTPLFSRSGKALVLTTAGREYIDHVRAALGLLAAAPQHRRAVQRLQRLRVTAPPTFARQVLVPPLAAFTAAHPHIELEVVLSVPYLHDAAADTDIEVQLLDTMAEGAPPALMHDIVLPVAAPSLVERLGPWATPAALADGPLLRTPVDPWLPWFRAAGLDAAEPSTGLKLVDLGLTLEAAACGQGIALARPTLAHAWLQRGALVPLSGIVATPARQYALLPPAPGEAAAAFARWLRGAAAEVERRAHAALPAAVRETLSARP